VCHGFYFPDMKSPYGLLVICFFFTKLSFNTKIPENHKKESEQVKKTNIWEGRWKKVLSEGGAKA
jgi:hypothetical protein